MVGPPCIYRLPPNNNILRLANHAFFMVGPTVLIHGWPIGIFITLPNNDNLPTILPKIAVGPTVCVAWDATKFYSFIKKVVFITVTNILKASS